MTEQPHLYRVGELYSPNRTKWDEFVEYNYRSKAHELRLFYKDPSPAEVAGIQAGKLEFALYPYRDAIFFCWRANGVWSDSASTIHLVSPEERILPDDVGNADERGLLTIFLINASNGILEVIRVVSFSPAFTRALHAAIWKQSQMPFPGTEAYMAQVQKTYAQFTSEQIATRLSIAQCKGGD